ncbi:tegument protein UL14-like protein [Phocid alphaherpesvirus 1]|uniref:Tegument protein UL14-like protein n=1 Tax=Phocid alphaherpesvirus 1 TaxID=47418 RepID=A0A482F3Q6_9ALPH|nr:tegument protein UL14-like protein [Phocid alphaherpesvirus 1]QBN85133.1 tegument protein UL14-like protein [Phocid alphaherpesvirus 1]UNP64268.1 tegument protein UL14-like protein [Phocid alphaherpesvirus 1]
MNFRSNARRRRLALEEAYQREAIFKAHTLDLIQEGVDRRNPFFVSAFTSAKQASLDLDRQLSANARIDAVEQKANALRIRVDSQGAISEVLNKHRRYIQPDFIRTVDSIEDSILEKEEQLNDVVDNIELETDTSDREWLNETDEALLTKWMLEKAPRMSMLRSHFPNPEQPTLPKPGGGTLMRKLEVFPSSQITNPSNPYHPMTSLGTQTAYRSTQQLSPRNSHHTSSVLNMDNAPEMENSVYMTNIGLKPNELLNLEEETLVNKEKENLEWLGGLPPLKNEDVQVFQGIPSINGPVF